ncbi:Crp/Fnr family transcriptional regulator [Peredibacter starrii]|uniref:Cyclic nucleotide-binding domain-containing protein n=1 Tax=Peredibacter starrii TaxID=28202 RepID=A0AAX4HKL7_9BACT|nr:cyclic nucleotide-binding domain-containing protein [Peredibacter starrii]WPU63792.1 cyclic nucleotide-binding domain-containing protein [Peredibacter starrii]
MAKELFLVANQILLREGEHSNSMYWLQKGQLIVTKQRGKEEIVLGHIYSGELVGEISFLDHEARSATVKAVTPCELIEIPQETIDGIFKSHPKWLEILVKTLAERLRKANARIKI